MNPGTLAIVALSGLLVAWYVAGHLYNRYHGRRMHGWLIPGLDGLGGEREQGWIGSPATGARVNVTHADPPFRRLEITLLLENRENPFLWLFDLFRKRRDRVVVRATLRSPRRGEVRVRSADGVGRDNETWAWEDGPHGLHVGYRGSNADRLVARLMPWLQAYGAHLHRFEWRKQDPHVDLELWTKGLLDSNSAAVLEGLGRALEGDEQGRSLPAE